MSWFQLDPESIVTRAKNSPAPIHVPTLAASITRGIIGFTIVSIAGFVPWAIFGRALHQSVGEAGMYIVCAIVFIGLAGLLMHQLIIGPGSLSRFYKLFATSFTAYSIAWIAGWMGVRGHPGSVVGLLSGTALMGWMIATAFDAKRDALKIIAALFILNSLGYFVGGVIEHEIAQLKNLSLTKRTQMIIAMLSWGVCYGIGFGAGLGLAFYIAQTKVRALLKAAPTA